MTYQQQREQFDDEVRDMIVTAHKAGKAASDLFLEQTNGGYSYCGFAWAKLPKGQRKLLEALKRLKVRYANNYLFGDKDYNGGWSVSIKGLTRASQTQCMSTKEEYMRAFCYVINNWDFSDADFKARAYVQSRAD